MSEAAAAAGWEEPHAAYGIGRRALHRLLRNPGAVLSFAVVAAIFVLGGLAPTLAPQGWNAIDLSPRWQNHAPMLGGWHLLGTDNIGRDALVRTLYGLHVSEQDAIFATLVATTFGLLVAAVAASRGGWLDAALMRLGDGLTIFPALMLLLVAYVFLEPVTVPKATAVLAAYLWVPASRVIRAHLSTLGESEYVEAARSLGASELQIFRRHLLPNVSGTLIVTATSLLGQVIMLEATVEFFGLGVPSQVQPTLGNLIGDAVQGRFQLGLGWWTWGAPAAVLAVILFCVNILGDAVEAALRPRG
jgi:peptide/nickel transport system permease protein